MFHYCSGIFIILFLWEHNFSSSPFLFLASVYIPFTASSPAFSWKCSVLSARILLLSNRVLRHKTLKRTDKQGHKALEEWGGERDGGRESMRVRNQHISVWWPSRVNRGFFFPSCHSQISQEAFILLPKYTVVLNVPALPSSARRRWATSRTPNGSQQLCSICSMSV